MKKLLSLSLVLVMLLSVAVVGASAASPEDFSDIPDDWSREGIISAVENGLLYGTDGKILPNDNLTRAQLAAIINRALNAKVMADVSGFTDVPAGAWFYEDIAKAVQAGTFGGDGNKMRPNDPITREETFVVLARAFLFPDGSVSGLNTYTDAGSVSEWAKNGVSALVGEGYVKGDNNNRINPKSNITRAEFATIMHRLVSEYISEPAEITEVTGDNVMINVADVTLKDVTINGNLYIGDGVGDGDVTLSGVTVSGRLAIRCAGADSIKIIGNSNIGTIIISRRDGIVRVYVEDGSEIEVVYIEDGSGDIIFEGSADSMIIEGEDVTVGLRNGSINVATINGKNSRIIVEE
ncbi:MAG: S-layer homology domain-containing protein, partial [Clostridiales bacterium]|nr:S-layer homology domain-containing protein [Clostridiales bacterium]